VKRLIPFILLAACLWLLLGGKLPEWPSIGGGATYFVLLHAVEKTDPRFAELKQEVQDSASPVGKIIAESGWRAEALDDNQTDKNDQPHPLLKKLGVFDTISDTRRELLAIAPPDKLVSKETIPADATADSVLKMIQAKGKR
jgi:hypothetical protein